MKKIIFALIATAGLVTACDPECDDKSLDLTDYTAKELRDCITFTTYMDEACTQVAEKDSGSYVKYVTSPATTVTILNKASDGSDNILAKGASGVFLLKPKRGQSNDQTVTIRCVNNDNSVVDTSAVVNVWVKADLDPEQKLLLGEAGMKKWGWAEDGYEVWGNAGNSGNGAGYGARNVDGKWWGVTESAELANSQMQHAAGDESLGKLDAQTGSYMIFDEDGNVSSYTADGNPIRKASYTLKMNFGSDNKTPDRGEANWGVGTLHTSVPAVLWPYSINEGGKTVTDFDVMYLDQNHMCLVYTKGNASGSWSEITYWRFKNLSPSEDMLEGASQWKWASDGVECWGNAGHSGNGAGYSWNTVDGKWWGVTAAADLSGQMQHSGDGNTADANNDAYMIFKDGKVTSYGADGTKIRGGNYTFNFYGNGRNNNWELGKLTTSEPALLFPWSINEGGKAVTEFDVMYMDGGNMTLVYTKGNAAGGWGEITYWRFASKQMFK